MGYDGLSASLAIEFDFETDSALNDPTYPHISVQYKKVLASSSHDYSLAFTYLR